MPEQKTSTNGLIRVLASTIVLRCKVRCFAWSLKPSKKDIFNSLVEGDYHLLDHMCDELAQAINQRGGAIPPTYSQLLKLSSVDEDNTSLFDSDTILKNLVNDHHQLIEDLEFLRIIIHQDNEHDIENLFAKMLEKLKSGIYLLDNLIKLFPDSA